MRVILTVIWHFIDQMVKSLVWKIIIKSKKIIYIATVLVQRDHVLCYLLYQC